MLCVLLLFLLPGASSGLATEVSRRSVMSAWTAATSSLDVKRFALTELHWNMYPPEGKLYELSVTDLADRLVRNALRGRRGKCSALLSGDWDPRLFNDFCLYVDPPLWSFFNDAADDFLVPPAVTLVAGPSARWPVIEATFQFGESVLALPDDPRIRPFQVTVTWELDDYNLVNKQVQRWSISPADFLWQALFETPHSGSEAQSDTGQGEGEGSSATSPSRGGAPVSRRSGILPFLSPSGESVLART
mmetsp:Transcript_33222/g.106064  ORF Transcript_33222/g.106064 Transcript_33222/m.106064 type:complete len:247 (+) Transcript_33222:74-814(+)